MPRIIPIRDLKDTAAISQMCSASKEPVFITKNGYGDMVIMSMKAYEERMLMQDVYAKLAEAEDEIRAGKTVDARTALKELRAKHGL
ncbi:MAG: type II toxin-antitoxin system Phd/YefM family antitoxin [Oscillibacter sp.]|nr:type II toxin-antitoxin system Phd/YefM family antitoxin [Oscillibacter sp.]